VNNNPKGHPPTARRANQQRHIDAEKRQMERCEAMLAEEARLKQPLLARCECGGILMRGHLNEHHCRFFGEAA
jgi:hypothetical protein